MMSVEKIMPQDFDHAFAAAMHLTLAAAFFPSERNPTPELIADLGKLKFPAGFDEIMKISALKALPQRTAFAAIPQAMKLDFMAYADGLVETMIKHNIMRSADLIAIAAGYNDSCGQNDVPPYLSGTSADKALIDILKQNNLPTLALIAAAASEQMALTPPPPDGKFNGFKFPKPPR